MSEQVSPVELGGRPERKDRLPVVSELELLIVSITAEITDDAKKVLAQQSARETFDVLGEFRKVVHALDAFKGSPNADTVIKDRTIVDSTSYSRLCVKNSVDVLALKSALDTLAHSCVSLFKKLSSRGRHAEGSTRFASILDYFNEVLGCNFVGNDSGKISINFAQPQPGYEIVATFQDGLAHSSVPRTHSPDVRPLHFALMVEKLCSNQDKLEEFIAKF